MLAEEKLRGSDQAEIAATLDQLSLLRRLLGKRLQALDGAPGWSRDSLRPLLPALQQLAEGGGPNARSAQDLIGLLAPGRTVGRHD